MTSSRYFRVANQIRQWRKVANDTTNYPDGMDQFKFTDLQKYARNLQGQRRRL